MTALHSEMTLSTLARETGLDKGQLSRAVTSLVKKNLIQSHVNDVDHRQNMLSLTKPGLNLHDQILPIMRQRQQGLTADITDEEMQTLFSVIEKLERASGHGD